MASIDLTALRFAAAVPSPVVFGRVQRPDGGGAAQRIDRLGNRWSFDCTTPSMAVEPEGRQWLAELTDAERLGGLIRVRQPNFDPGAPGNPVVATNTAAGRSVPLSGLTPHYPIRKGQFVSIVHAGQRYFDMVMDQAIAATDGTATIRLNFLIRTPLSAGDVVELAWPKIEGTLEFAERPGWATNRLTSFHFTITEDA